MKLNSFLFSRFLVCKMGVDEKQFYPSCFIFSTAYNSQMDLDCIFYLSDLCVAQVKSDRCNPIKSLISEQFWATKGDHWSSNVDPRMLQGRNILWHWSEQAQEQLERPTNYVCLTRPIMKYLCRLTSNRKAPIIFLPKQAGQGWPLSDALGK